MITFQLVKKKKKAVNVSYDTGGNFSVVPLQNIFSVEFSEGTLVCLFFFFLFLLI